MTYYRAVYLTDQGLRVKHTFSAGHISKVHKSEVRSLLAIFDQV